MANFSPQGQRESSRKGNNEPARFVDGIIRNNAPVKPQVKATPQKAVQENKEGLFKRTKRETLNQPSLSSKAKEKAKNKIKTKRSWFSRIFFRSNTTKKIGAATASDVRVQNSASRSEIQKMSQPTASNNTRVIQSVPVRDGKNLSPNAKVQSPALDVRLVGGIRPIKKKSEAQAKGAEVQKTITSSVAHSPRVSGQGAQSESTVPEKGTLTPKKQSGPYVEKKAKRKTTKPARNRKKKPTRSYKSPQHYQTIFASKNKRLRNLVRGVGFIGVVIGGVMIGGAFLFDRAMVFVKPVSFILPVQQRVDLSNTGNQNAIELEYVVFSGTVKQEITIEERTQTPIKASGKLVLYNETENDQQLSPSTRFESEDGFIYLGPDEIIIIPGQEANTPGIKEIIVTAEKAGPQYNTSQAARFVIPAWRESNSPKFDLQYGRAPAGIIGGAEQGVYIISQDLRNQVIVPMRQSLQQSMLTHAVVDVPDGFVFFERAFLLDTDELEIIEDNRGRATHVSLKGRGALILFPQNELVKTIFQDHNYQGDDDLVDLLAITNPSNVNMTYSEEADEFMRQVLRKRKIEEETNTDLGITVDGQAEGGNFQIGLNGDIGFRADIDIQALEEEIAGTERLAWQDIFSTNNGIERASVGLKPFWKKRAPGNTNDIIISIEK